MSIRAIVMGGGAIGSAIAQAIVETNSNTDSSAPDNDSKCILTYRNNKPDIAHPNILLYQLDATKEEGFVELAETAKLELGKLNWVINTIGVLHDDTKGITPEKRINDFKVESFREVVDINVLPTMFAAKYLIPLYDRSSPSVFCAISAKVGSIEDNQLGGWYSYRASKACLNMMLKNLSIEFKQKNRNLCILSLHPGTTDSNLSAPFQRNVPAGKLFSPERTAKQLLDIIASAKPRATGNFYSWDGQQIPW